MKNEELKNASGYIKKHRLQKRWQKVVTGLAAVVVFCTTYALILPAITLEKEPDKQLVCSAEKLNIHQHTAACYDASGALACGYADFVIHTHNESCYDADGNLVCTLPEIAAHTHDESCYTVTSAHTHTEDCYTMERGELICTLTESEGHTHSAEAGCYDESGNLICTLAESEGHTHSDDCYAWNKVLTCGLTETEGGEKVLVCGRNEIVPHEHTEACYAPDGKLTCGKLQVLEHVHNENCFETVEEAADAKTPKCGLEENEEHTHSLACYSDPNADLETAEDWEKTFSDVKLTGVWADDLLSIAATQLGYTESESNYEVEDNGTATRGYTRYGEWYGLPYGDWCAMFIDFCLNYADIPEEYFPRTSGCVLWIEQLSGAAEGYESFDLYKSAGSGYVPTKGDLIFFDTDGDDKADHVGIVSEYTDVTPEEAESGLKAQIKTIEGNLYDAVAEAAHDADDETIVGYAVLPENPNPPEETEETTIEYTAEDGAVFTATGNLPEGAYLVALPLTDEQMTYIKENLVTLGENTAAFAYDIKIYGADGEELKLTDSVKITVSGLGLDADADVTGYHFVDVDADTLTDIPAGEMTPEKVDVTAEENGISFDASGFSVRYFIVNSANDGIMTLAGSSAIYDELTDSNMGDAKVDSINVSIYADGTAPFDNNNNPGNDQNDHNGIVRSFDTVAYQFSVETTAQNSYKKARIKLTFTLEASDASFDTDSMKWMDTTEGYEWGITEKNGAQILTCYYLLNAGEGNTLALPGTFSDYVYVKVNNMEDGATVNLSAGACVAAAKDRSGNIHTGSSKYCYDVSVDVSAAPKYNITIQGSQSTIKDTFDLNSGKWPATAYGDGYSTTSDKYTGRLVQYIIVIQLYNDANKGMKGIELPDGDVTMSFDLSLDGSRYISQTSDTIHYTNNMYTPKLWSIAGNDSTITNYDDGRTHTASNTRANQSPWNSGGGTNSCWNGGTWTASQSGMTISVTVSGIKVDTEKMPATNADGSGSYADNVGCISAGVLYVLQPFNVQNSTTEGPDYDVVKDWKTGTFHDYIKVGERITVSGREYKQTHYDENDYTDVATLLLLPGELSSQVAYSRNEGGTEGVGVSSKYDGKDYAMPGTELYIIGGLSYDQQGEDENRMIWGTSFVRFYGSVLEVDTLNSVKDGILHSYNADPEFSGVLYAAKSAGGDWTNDEEMLNATEDSMVFYDTYEKLKAANKTCVGLLFWFYNDQNTYTLGGEGYMLAQPMKVKSDIATDKIGKAYQTVATARVWTEKICKNNNVNLVKDGFLRCYLFKDTYGDNSALNRLPSIGYPYVSDAKANNYRKTIYNEDGGVLQDHSSNNWHWGDTLLVIGYKTGVTKQLAQKTSDGNEKEVYSLDAQEHYIDFVLKPTITTKDGGTNSDSITLTIEDTLPKYLTYVNGSSYLGKEGDYIQPAKLGEQGTYSSGAVQLKFSNTRYSYKSNGVTITAILTVTKNSNDGTTNIKWVLTVPKNGNYYIPYIYYTAYVSGAPEGTTTLINTAKSYAPLDKQRELTLENGNYTEREVILTCASATAYGKVCDETEVESNGEIHYTINYVNNSAQTISNVNIFDFMPDSGYAWSNKKETKQQSSFSGSYTITSFTASISSSGGTIENKDASFSYSNSGISSNYFSMTATQILDYISYDNMPDDEDYYADWTDKSLSSGTKWTVDFSALSNKTPRLWRFWLSQLPSGASLEIKYTIKLKPGTTVLNNTQYVNVMSVNDTVQSTVTTVKAKKASIEGLVWLDTNGNGIQDADEERLNGITVTLWKLNEYGLWEEAYNKGYYVVVVETGQQASLQNESGIGAVDYEKGRYKFTDLEPGTYAVEFSDFAEDYKVSPANEGTDDKIDSDAIRYTTNLSEYGNYNNAQIREIVIPEANNYESKYNDCGFYVSDTNVSYDKKCAQDYVEADGTIDYTVYYENDSYESKKDVTIVDAMPVSGVRNSNFSGTYKVTSFKVTLTGANGKTLKDIGAKLYYTTASRYDGDTLMGLYWDKYETDTTVWKGDWKSYSCTGTSYTWSGIINTMPHVWYLECTSLPAGAKLTIEYSIELEPGANATLDDTQYVNQVSADEHWIQTVTKVVQRSIEGLVWNDENRNGIQDEGEELFNENVAVSLWVKENGKWTRFRYEGGTFALINIGEQVSARAYSNKSAEDYEPGHYKFTDLPPGTYAVSFTGSIPENWEISPANQGNDDTIDSDAVEVTDEIKTTGIRGVSYIGDIVMPEISQMKASIYESKNNDSGFYKLNGVTYGKTCDQELVEADGEISYTIYYDNDSASDVEKLYIVDSMPYNGKLDSKFNGSWTITSFKASLSGGDSTESIPFYFTFGSSSHEKYVGYTANEMSDKYLQSQWAAYIKSGTTTEIDTVKDKNPPVWKCYLSKVPAGARIEIKYTIKLEPGTEATLEGTQYVNMMSVGDETFTTTTKVVRRTIEGRVWLDVNANGIQDDGEESLSENVTVYLYKTEMGGTGGASIELIKQMNTGMQMSVRESEASTYEPGLYKFTDLAPGTYTVEFRLTNDQSAKFLASPVNQGDNDEKDSDGKPCYNNNGLLAYTYINNISMPPLREMTSELYESMYHDSGFYEKGYELPETGGEGTTTYTIGGSALLICAGALLVYKNKKRGKEDSISS